MPETIRDENYLGYVRDIPCLVCAAPPPSDPHHLDSGVTGSKGDDWTCVPLCRKHHREYHSVGERKMEDRYPVNLWKCAHRILRRYHKNNG
jgi:hypothetical protein